MRLLTLRDALKLDTQERHRALDGLLSSLNLLIPDRRRAFCTIQLSGFLQLGCACNWDAAEGTQVLRRQVAALEAELGRVPNQPQATALRLHPDAVAYVTLGAQLGAAMMRRALPEDQHTGLFALEPDMSAWRAFCERMKTRAPDSPEARIVLDDAKTAFSVFHAAAEAVLAGVFPAAFVPKIDDDGIADLDRLAS